MHPDVERLVSRATNEELVALTAGTDFWHTAAIPRLGDEGLGVLVARLRRRSIGALEQFDEHLALFGRHITLPFGRAFGARRQYGGAAPRLQARARKQKGRGRSRAQT